MNWNNVVFAFIAIVAGVAGYLILQKVSDLNLSSLGQHFKTSATETTNSEIQPNTTRPQYPDQEKPQQYPDQEKPQPTPTKMPTLMPKDYKINPTNGHKYFLTTRVAWKDAQQQALAAGGNLVTINDAQEQKWLVNQFGNREQFWIGLHRNAGNGNFEWMSGQPVKYQNWDARVPDNVPITPKGEARPIGEDFVVMNSNPDVSGKWNDVCSCKGTLDNGRFVDSSSYPGIVEIEDK